MTDPSREQAAVLLRKAREDDYACRALSGDKQASPWIIGFHAQQAVEKSIKAVLALHRVGYPHVHDIEALLKLLRQGSIPSPPDAENLPRLTPLAALMRYEDESDEGPSPSVTLDWMLTSSAQTICWAEQQLNKA
ncbi:MAG: HEPN domain-containing protein [Planctomycetes bacterium]|nr:HEPN domain-containing protein [Planctomycetota bacterium]